jgi:hypothetical protein
MITKDIQVEVKEKAEYPPLPEKVYQVELLDINLEERPTYDTRNKPENERVLEDVLNFQFTLLNGKDKEGNSLRGRNVWENFVPKFLYISKKNGKNKLYQITEALLGEELSPEHIAMMDTGYLNAFIGKQCQVVIKNVKKDDRVYDKIESYISVDSEMTALTPVEKEKASVKKDKEEIPQVKDEPVDNEIRLEDIPFG